MKNTLKPSRGPKTKRDLFAELREGMKALADARRGKRTLRTHALKVKPTTQQIIVAEGNLGGSNQSTPRSSDERW